jgi:ABC-type glutathione transport system ATPase component
MKQKLAIACGLLHEPRALLLDEPLTGLDPGAIRRMKQTILQRAAAGAAVILSSHLLGLVEELCSRILVIQQGSMVAMGSMAEIVAHQPELAGRGLEEVFLALTERRPGAVTRHFVCTSHARRATAWSGRRDGCARRATPLPSSRGWPTSSSSSAAGRAIARRAARREYLARHAPSARSSLACSPPGGGYGAGTATAWC